ncbi:helix-turn-helix domain-containing protein [Levilactobacillus andaensis]|uniref:helix-turn-helix domain-containing protein n=1 Tax=Levilactobacillus andaensis TaxID=2799570 RepID=UPI0019452357|nr:helix-turn-helix transcriptional regulator [Levilactobacillus andaensis]
MIKLTLNVVMAQRNISSNDLAEQVGITPTNLSILKTGKARAIRFSTLERLCAVLACQPGEILRYVPDEH